MRGPDRPLDGASVERALCVNRGQKYDAVDRLLDQLPSFLLSLLESSLRHLVSFIDRECPS